MRVCVVLGQAGEGARWREGVGRTGGGWLCLPLHEGALRGSGFVCSRGPAPGPRGPAGGMHRAAGPLLRAGQEESAACPGTHCVRGRHTHLLKSKGIVPPPPGMGALQARCAAAPRGSQPAANASSGRPAPAGRPPPPTPAARLPPPGSDAPRSPLGAARPPPASSSATRLKGPAGREGEGRAFGVEAGGGRAGSSQRRVRSFEAPLCVFLHFLSVALGKPQPLRALLLL